MTPSRRLKRTAIGVGAILIASFILLILLELLIIQGRSVQATLWMSNAPTSEIFASRGALTSPLRLNEVMIDNRSVIRDQAGDFDSWVELYNTGLLPLDIGGMALSNDALSPTQWLIPDGTIIPGHGYLLIWTDGEPDEGPFHTNFVLTAGQAISLFDKQVFDRALVDHLRVNSTPSDWSWARHPDGRGPWILFERPSPGTLNAISWVYLPLIVQTNRQLEKKVLINELMAANNSTLADEAGEYDDWIELYNPGPEDVDVGGMYLSDDLGNLPRWQIPAGTVISAGGYLLFWADDQQDQGLLHTNFRLNRQGEMVTLAEADGHSLLDWINFSAQQDDVSFGRLPDGADNWQSFIKPTPGGSNTLNSINITGTTHQPTIPGVSDTVTVTTRIVATYPPVTVTLIYDVRVSLSQTLKLFTQTAMLDDGTHGDGDAGDGVYGAQIPPQPSQMLVRYYIQVRDALGQTATDPVGAPDDTYHYAVGLPLGTLFINEFMAANSSVISDSAGDFDDWIELYNSSPITLNLGGFYLTDDLEEPTRWQIPTGTTLPAGDFMLIWADSELDEGPLHASFKLNARGEEVGLFGPDGLAAVDALTYPAQAADLSFGRYPDGAGTWQPMLAPTPGYANALLPPPVISSVAHTPTIPMPGAAVTVTALVTDDGAIVSVTLNYDAGDGLTQTLMWDDGTHGDGEAGDNLFGAPIPAQPNKAVIYYFVRARDDLGLTSDAPLSAPDLLYRYVVGGGGLPLYINEFMASNSTVISDAAGEFDDWIELYNAGPTPVRLGGMYLSDDLAGSTSWRIPYSVIMPAGGFILFWADRDTDQGDTHADFKLRASGEDVALFDALFYGNALIDGLGGYPAQATDESYGRSGDGGPTWRTFTTPTPGESNSP